MRIIAVTPAYNPPEDFIDYATQILKTADELVIVNDGSGREYDPEGTRNTAQGLLPFHNGVFKIAKKANSPIVIMSVSGTDQIRKNWYKCGSEVRLNVLGVIPADELAEMKTAQIGEITRELIADELLKMA